jgi:PmbA protein
MSTTKELLQTAKQIVAGARKRGAKQARASVYRSRENRVEWRDGKLDRLRESTRMGASVTLFVDGRYSAHTTSDLRPAALERFLDGAVAMTRVLEPDPHRKLPDPARYGGRHEGDLGLLDAAAAGALTAQERRRAAASLEAAARACPEKDKIISVTGTFSDTLSESVLVNSNGMEGERRGTSFFVVAQTSVRGKGNRKPSAYAYASRRRRADLPALVDLGQEATRRALQELGAGPEKSGRYACVLENRVVGRLLWGLIGPLTGNAIQQKRSFLADKLGHRLAAPLLDITDDPLLVGGLSSRPYDSEGMSAVRRPILARGVLRSFFLDTYYASKLSQEPTIGGPTNLVFSTGKGDLPALLRAMGRGILVTGFSGGNANAATGDFSIGVRGLWIEKGAVVRPVAEMNLAGNHLTFWRALRELGNDAFRSSSFVTPSLRFGPVQFSGV